MDLETLQVIFDMNTERIQPKLDALQQKFSRVFDRLEGTAKSGSEKTEDSMSVSEGSKKMADELGELNDRTKGMMDKFNTIINGGAEKAAKSMTSNMGKMRTDTMKSVDSMVADIDSKMDQARAAQERMMNLRGMKSDSLDAGDNKQASRYDEQAASAQARMVRYQNQAKALAQELNDQAKQLPGTLNRIADGMDENEAKIEAIRRKIKGLEVAEKDAYALDPNKGFNAEPSVPTDKSRAIAEQINKERASMNKLIATSDALNDQYGRLEDRSKALAGAGSRVDTSLESEGTQTRSLRENFARLGNEFSAVGSRMRSVLSSIARFTGLSRLSRQFRELRGDSSSLISRLVEVGNRGSRSMNKLNSSAHRSESSMRQLTYGLKSLPAQFIVWGIGFEAMSKFSTGLLNAAKTDREFNASLNAVKANLMTAFYPLYTAIIPWLDAFMNTLAKATGWLAQFSAALFGMSNNAARSGAAGLYKQTKAMGDTATATSKATKELQKHNAAITAHNRAMQQAVAKENAAITAHNKAMQAAVQKENAQIKSRNAARRKAIQDENADIRAENEKRSQAVKDANAKIKASNKKVADDVAKQNDAQKEKIAELKKKYQDYKNSLMGFDEINTLDVSQDIPDYTPKKAKQQALETYKAKPTKQSDFTPESLKHYTPEPLKHYTPKPTESATSLDDYNPDGVDNDLKKSMAAFGGAAAAARELKKILAELFKPMKEAWDKEGAGVVKEAKYALNEIERLLGDIGRSFMKVWDGKTGVRMLTDILRLLKTVLGIIGDVAKAFAQAWEDHGAGTKYIRSIFNAFDSILKVLIEIGKSFRKAWDDGGTGRKIASDLLKLFTDINKLIIGIANSFRKAWTEGNTGTKLFSAWLKAFDQIVKLVDSFVNAFRKAWAEGGMGTKIFNNILKIATNVGKTIGALASQFRKAWDSGKLGQSIFHTILGVANDVVSRIKDMSSATVTFAKHLDFRPLLESIKSLFSSLRGLNKTVWDALDWGYKNVLLPLAKFTISKVLPNFFQLLASVIKVVNAVLKALAPLAKSLFNAFLKPFAGYTGGKGISTLQLITKSLDGLANWINKHQSTVRDFAKVLGTLFGFKIAMGGFTKGVSLLEDLNKALFKASVNGKGLRSILEHFTGLDKIKNAFGTLKSLDQLKFSKLKDGASSAKSFAGVAWSKLKDGAKWAGDLAGLGWSKLKTGAVIIVDFVKGIKDWSIWSKLAAAGQAALNLVMDTNPFILIASAIAAVVAGLVLLYKHDKKFRDFCNDIFKNITKWLGDAITWLKKNWSTVALAIVDPVGAVAKWFYGDTKTGKAIVKWGKGLLKDAVNWAKGIGAGISNAVSKGKKELTKASSNIYKWLSGKAETAFDTVKSKAKTLGKDISSRVNSAKKGLQKVSSNIQSWLSSKAKDAFKAVSSKAKSLGKDISGFISKSKKVLTKAGSNVHDWLSSKSKDAFKTVSSKAKSLGKDISNFVSKGKKDLTKAGSNVRDWVSSKAKDAFKTVSSKAKGIGKYIHDHVNDGKSEMTKASSNIKSWVSSKAKDAFKTVSDKAKSIGSYIYSHIKSGKGAMESASKTIYTAVHSKASSAFTALEKRAKSLGGNIASGLKKGISGIKSAGRSIANAIVGTIGAAVNGVIDGLKWILRHVGASGMASNMSHWHVPHYATGGVHQGGLAVVNDADDDTYQESYELPNGKQGLFPKKRNLVADLPYGTKIKTAMQTEKDIYDQLPHYAQGVSGNTWTFNIPTGSSNYELKFGPVLSAVSAMIGSQVQNLLKGLNGSNILWDAAHPKSIINEFTSSADSFNSNNSLGTALAHGANSKIRSGATSTIEKALKSFANKQMAKIRSIIRAAEDAYKRAVEAAKKAAEEAARKAKEAIERGKREAAAVVASITRHKKRGHELGGLVTEPDDYPLAENGKPEMVLPLSKPKLALGYIAESLQQMGYSNTGVTMPASMTKSQLPVSMTPSTSQGNSAVGVQGDGVSGMQQAIVNAITLALQQNSSVKSANASGQPVEVTVKIGDESFGKHAIKGINAVNRKNGHNMLNL
ncbi:hypothetical protein HC026_11130 [Lactobacillus sp. LC28-10]|uniref:Minor tail protein n=1 Tax=Secundilactobacillus angelensis TaxID=2722706 RepID=A0ABX1L1R1_9LACO|nr:hypothetical protein [Secundilactobacillus angelensis]MCH5463196.1 hypothetical protein [Secundilactobacillus angelensis]NLR19445.1 hypothetical protein [Secundilactobacillus angelensis]